MKDKILVVKNDFEKTVFTYVKELDDDFLILTLEEVLNGDYKKYDLSNCKEMYISRTLEMQLKYGSLKLWYLEESLDLPFKNIFD